MPDEPSKPTRSAKDENLMSPLLPEPQAIPAVTHAALVDIAVAWLRRRCGVVLREHGGGRELPDAIGWKGGFSWVVEVKVSRADFRADQKKPSRASATVRPGYRCWYLTPPGLLTVADIPDGWDLLEYDGARVRVRSDRHKGYDDRDPGVLRAEIYRLYCEVRRYQIHGLTYPSVNVRRDEARRRRIAGRAAQCCPVSPAVATLEHR
jgi:hypothetical protein